MEFKITSFKGAGNLHLGMTSSEIEKIVGIAPKKFKKYIFDKFDTDAYEGFFVYFKEPGIAEAIEFNNKSTILFNEENLFGKSFGELKEYFQSIDDDLELESTGLTSNKFGIGIFAPYAESQPEDKPEGIIIFEKGYYD